MFGAPFYNETYRRVAAVFGTLFNEITIEFVDDQGNKVKDYLVPFGFAPKQKFYAALRQKTSADYSEDDSTRVRMTAPRMAYDIGDPAYDPNRQSNKHNKIKDCGNPQSGNYSLQRVPYNIGFEVYIYSKTLDAGLRILEQILPYFEPSLNIPFKAHAELDITEDLKVTLESVSRDDQNDGGPLDTTVGFVWTLTFNTSVYFYKPVTTQGLITDSTARIALDCPPAEFAIEETYTGQ